MVILLFCTNAVSKTGLNLCPEFDRMLLLNLMALKYIFKVVQLLYVRNDRMRLAHISNAVYQTNCCCLCLFDFSPVPIA